MFACADNDRDVFQDHVRYLNGLTAGRKWDIHTDRKPPNADLADAISKG
jgi:hypothetical protein